MSDTVQLTKEQFETIMISLQFYANKSNWRPTEYLELTPVEQDGGHRARRSLEVLAAQKGN